ncbi:serine-protein kinase ATM [Diachasma alloeum]|uniref:serine-protein kinase ATM n=1 Tax=Diachasma alloeum TaxID=454923 RepID=UPI00073811BA|nr:serine-protein kinase ATM [Diachasma alloeum]
MSDLFSNLEHNLRLAEGTGVSGVSKGLSELQETLSSTSVRADITTNSLTLEHPLTWNSLLLRCHQCLVNLTKCTRDRKRPALQRQSSCCSILTLIMRYASTPTAVYLDLTNLMQLVNEILTGPNYEECHNEYMVILHDCILPNTLYRAQMTLEDWRNLLDISVSLHKSQYSNKTILIEIVRKIVLYGCQRGDFHQEVLALLPFLLELFNDVVINPSMLLNPASRLLTTIIQQIGTENRRTLCEFTEKLLPSVLSILTAGGRERDELLYHIVLLHHPRGATRAEGTSYANSWSTWRRIMLTIQNSIFRGLEPMLLEKGFLALGTEVLHQVLVDEAYKNEVVNGTIDDDGELGPQAKRRKLFHSIQSPLDLFDKEFSGKNLENRWPVVQLLTTLLTKYPGTLKASHFQPILKITSELFTEATKEPKVMDTLCHLGRTLIKIERTSFGNLEKRSSKYWDKIFDNVLITLGKGHNEVEGHKLLQMLIEYRGVHNVNAFVNLYFTNAIKWSSSSVETLLVLCSHVVILEDSSPNSGRWEGQSDRQRLIRWGLEVPGCRVLSPDALEKVTKLVTGLVLKTWDRRFAGFQIPGEVELLEFHEDDLRCIDSIQKCHLSLDFETDLFDGEVVKCPEKAEPLKLSIAERNFNFCLGMISDLLDFPGELPEDVSSIISRLTIVAKCLSNFLELEVECGELESLISEFVIQFSDVLEMMSKNGKLKRGDAHVVGVLKALVTLFSSKYHKRIATIILEGTPREILKCLFLILNFEEKSEPSDLRQLGIKYYERIFDMKSSSEEKESQITIGTHQVLTAFSLLQSGALISERQFKVLKNLLKAEIYKAKLLTNLWKALALLQSILKTPPAFFIPNDLPVHIGNFILGLFQLWDNDFHGVKGILELLPGFIELFSKIQIDYEGLLGVLKASVNTRDKGYSGPVIQTTYLEAMYRIMKLKPSSSPHLMTSEELFRYVCSDLYVVRMESLKILHLMFSSNAIPIVHKKHLVEKIEEMEMSKTNSIFVVNQDLSPKALEDEEVNRTVTSLYVLGTVIHASGVFHPQALNIMFRLHTKRGQEISLMKKIFSAAIPRENERLTLIRNNLYDLMKTGMQQGVSIGNFWKMTNCSSEVDFYETYIGIFILIKLEIHEFHKIETLCQRLGVPFAKAIEDNFPAILSWMLAAMVKVPDRDARRYLEEIYVKLRENSGPFKYVRKFSELLEEKLSDVLLDFLQRLHDRDHFKKTFQVSVYFPKMTVPNFRCEVIVKGLDELKRCVMGESRGSLVQYLIVKHPDMVQKILSTLVRNIHDQTMIEYKLKVFHHYSFFCQLLMSEIGEEYFNEMSTFVVRDISYTLVHFLKDTNKLFLQIVLDFMYQFLKKLLPSRSREVSGILNYLTTNLISMIQSSKDKQAIKILKLLITESTEDLQESIKTLGAFPNTQEFDEIRTVYNSLKEARNETWTLASEMEHFLNAGQEKTLSCSIEGLVHLRKQLSEHRDELQRMYKDLEKLRGFAEDCASSVLHRLTYRLIKLTESSNVNMTLEASKCLGELGPTDLTTMILHPEEGHLQESAEAIDMLTETIISKLSDHLIEDSLELREASSAALYKVYSSHWGQQIIKKYKKDLGKGGPGDAMLTILKNTRPFLMKSTARARGVEVDGKKCAMCFIHNNDIWKGEGGDSYSSWIKRITCTVLGCFKELYTSSLIPVCGLNVEFCESILPRLIFLLTKTAEELLDYVCGCINLFFEGYFQAASFTEQTFSPVSPRMEVFSHESVRCMLNIVNFLRIQSSNNFESKLNYLPIAKAAQYCSAYFTSLLYAELSSEALKMSLRPRNNISVIDHLCEARPDEGKALQEILREAFIKIGDPDSIHGCGLSHLKDQSSRIQHYIQFNKWDIAMTAQDVELSSGLSCSRGMINALQHTGLDHLLSKYLSTIKNEENVEEYAYETAWRLADWNMLCKPTSDSKTTITSSDYEYHHYHSLKCLHEGDSSGVKSSIENARLSIINSLRNISLECSQTIYPKLLKLQMLREVEELHHKSIDHWPEVISDWRQQNLSNMNDFPYIEPILSQRIAMFKIGHKSGSDLSLKNSIVDTYLELSRVAQAQGYLHIAGRALESLGRTPDLSEEMKDRLNYRESVLAWTRSDHTIAKFLLRNLITKPENKINPRLLSLSLELWGKWMAETKSETPQVIKEHYQRSIEIIQSISSPTLEDFKNLNNTRAALAQFADAQYEYTTEFMKTPLFESLKQTAKFVREGGLRAKPKGDRHVISAMNKNEKTDKNDSAEYEKIQKEQSMYLTLAVEYYCKILIDDDYNDFLVFRLVSLWFKNMEHEGLNDILEQYLHLIPSHKFIALIPQLAPHISTERSLFSTKINSLIRRCAKEHPHHVLPGLLSLRNTNKDNEFHRKMTSSESVRVDAAKSILEDLMQTDIRKIIEEMTRMAEALMMLAYYQFDKKRSGMEMRIPDNQQIHRIKNFQNCMVPTINLQVQPNGNYSNVVGILEFKRSFETLGGINAPKKIYCVGMNGVIYNQVIKVDADIKTDSIMQQVFTVMNSMFRSSKETKRRKLNIRTYKVVSLSQQSGVLQWCDNTIPMSSVLLGPDGLHERYHERDWKPEKCRAMVENAKNNTDQERLRVYLTICEHLHPAFQYFFLEKFPSPETWFERRMAYVRSVATTSMVGYILGLGDRHFSNILIDQTTAEIVHIDFGIAFEQGKVLPIPETIPFRLTRDMEAAMGVSGVEGVMRRCCEETMGVLRDRREMIITLLQVLIYDPLFSWSISPYKAYKMQSEDSSRFSDSGEQDVKPTNKMAERALLRIDQKLHGTEEGIATSIAGQVERLIQQARDPANLSRIFCGWQAYL